MIRRESTATLREGERRRAMTITEKTGDGATFDVARYERLQDRLSLLADAVSHTAFELDHLWTETLSDGEMMTRVVEASHSLHRAVLALRGTPFIGA
jgi:hypothetical protein